MKTKIIKAIALIAMLAAVSIAHAENRNSINIKTASFTLSETNQNIGFSTYVFDESSSSVFSVEYERKFGKDLSWGVETTSYSNDIISGGFFSNKLDTLIVMGTVRKYFKVSKYVQPYIGAGAGVSAVRNYDSGSGSGSAGIAFQGMAGIQFPFDSISAILEYKFISSEAENEFGATVDVSGSGIFAGIGINF